MPLYEFNNRETGESVGELHLTIEAMEEFLEMNPHLCVRPGILRFAQFKTAESFPSYPEIDNQTRSESDKNENGEWTITEPASWNDSKPDSHKTGIKITDKRKNKISHFDEDIKNYGKIVGTPTFKGNEPHEKIDFSEPVTRQEMDLQVKMDEEENPRKKYDKNLAGNSSDTAINPQAIEAAAGPDVLMPWEKGFVNQNKHRYTKEALADQQRWEQDQMETYDNAHPEEE